MSTNFNWQTIETAPKTGEAILVYVDGDRYVARWTDPNIYPPDKEDPYSAKSDQAFWHVDDGRHGPSELLGCMEPTHWMPLPEPSAPGAD